MQQELGNKSQMPEQPAKKASLLKCFLIVLVLLIAWQLIAPIFGVATGLAGGALSIVIATIAILCVAVVLSFIWVGIAAFVIAGVVVIWVIIAIALFPILLPFLIPAFIIVLLVRLFFGRGR